MNEYNWIIGLSALILTMMTMQAGFGAWISNQFNKVRAAIYSMRDDVLAKLEYHERHDDRRFGELGDDIWEIRVRLAQLDGTSLNPNRPHRTDQCLDKTNQYLRNVKKENNLRKPLS